MKVGRKGRRRILAGALALSWVLGPLLPASLCMAMGNMAGRSQAAAMGAETAAVPAAAHAHCHDDGAPPPSTPRSHDCTDPLKSCCLSVSAPSVVAAEHVQLPAPHVAPAMPIALPAAPFSALPVRVARRAEAPRARPSPPVLSVFRL